jgi:cytoskeletal protein RodZ
MKRCPVCDSSFPDADQFCELDGAQLVNDYSDDSPPSNAFSGAEGIEYLTPGDARGRQNAVILATVAIAAVAIGAVLFVVYRQMTQQPDEPGNGESSNASVNPQQAPLLTARPTAYASISPSPEPSPSPSANASPSVQADAGRVVLSSSPVSTGGDDKLRSGTVKIRLANGTSVEADEVWETGEGIWYRRSGVVTLLERDQVTGIDRAPPAPSPAATPATAPSASP